MNLLTIYVHVYHIFTILKIVNTYVLLAANMNDVKTIAREFAPEDLVEQLVRAMSDISFNKTVLRKDSDEQSEDSSSDDQSANEMSIEPHLIARKTDVKENYANKGKKINFEQLVQKVKKRLEKEINKKIQIPLDNNTNIFETNVSLGRGRKKKSTLNTSINNSTIERYALNSTSEKPPKSWHDTEETIIHSKNITYVHNDDAFTVTHTKNTKSFSRKEEIDSSDDETTKKVELRHEIEKNKNTLINKKHRFKIEERKDLIDESFDENNTDFKSDPVFSELERQSKTNSPSALNKNKYNAKKTSLKSDFENNVEPKRVKLNKSKDTNKIIGTKSTMRLKQNKNKRYEITEVENSIYNNKSRSLYKKDHVFAELESQSQQGAIKTKKWQKGGRSKTDSYNEDNVTPVKKKVLKNKLNKKDDVPDTSVSSEKVDKNNHKTLKNKKPSEPETSDSSEEDRSENTDEDKEKSSSTDEETERETDSEKSSTTRRSLGENKNRNKGNSETISNKNNKLNKPDKVKKNRIVHNKSNESKQTEDSDSTDDETKKKQYAKKDRVNKKRITVSKKPSKPVKQSSEEVFDDEFTISTIASSEIKGETQSLDLMDGREIKIKPTRKLLRDVYEVSVPDFVKKTTSFAEKYNFDEPIPEGDRKREEIKYLDKKEKNKSTDGEDSE